MVHLQPPPPQCDQHHTLPMAKPAWGGGNAPVAASTLAQWPAALPHLPPNGRRCLSAPLGHGGGCINPQGLGQKGLAAQGGW